MAAQWRAAAGRRTAGAGYRGRTQLVGQRTVLVTAHTGRENALRSARFVTERLLAAGIAVRTLAGEFSAPGAEQVAVSDEAAAGAELVMVLGGDGTLLRAAEFSRPEIGRASCRERV